MTKITTLTSDQEIALRTTYDEWLAIGRSTTPIDQDGARHVFTDLYARIGEPAPATLFFSSPLMCILAFAAIKHAAKALGTAAPPPSSDGVLAEPQLWTQLETQLGTQLETQLGTQLRTQLGTQLRTQLGTQLGTQLWTQLEPQLEPQLGTQLRTQLEPQLEPQLRTQLGTYMVGDQWCAWKVFYDFCRRIGVRYAGDAGAVLDLWMTEARTCHWWWPYKGLVLASERPLTVQVDGDGRLHCEDGLALGYRDGWGVYALHGVRVPDWLVLTPVADLDPRRLLREANVEVRREFVRKVGIERVCAALGSQTVDTRGDYALVLLDLQDGRRRPYLKMKNPSIGVYHLEGVHPDCATVQQALNWRAYGRVDRAWAPIELT